MAETTSGLASAAPSNPHPTSPRLGEGNEQATQTSPTPQTPEERASQDKPVNLFELPEFKQYQRQQSQSFNNLQQQLRQTQQQLKQSMTKDMDDVERLQFHIRELQDEIAWRDQQTAQTQAETNRFRILQTIADATGVTVSDLNNQGFDNADDAWRWASKQQVERERKALKREERQERREAASDVDLGGGAPSTATNKWKSDVQAAMERKDALAYTRLMRERPK